MSSSEPASGRTPRRSASHRERFEWIWGYRLFRVVGFGIAVGSLLLYVSPENRPVLGRWSYGFTAFTALMFFGWLVYLWRTIGGAKLRQGCRSRSHRVSENAWEAAVFTWGLAYLLSALDTPMTAARVLDANIMGSTTPVAVALEWASMAAILVILAIVTVSNRHHRWINLMVPVLGIGALFVVGEGVFRAKAVLYPSVQGLPTNSSTLWRRRFVRRNHLNFRDEDHALAKPDTVHRLLVIGDSYAFGWGIRQTVNRFGERIVNTLSHSTKSHWESLNASEGNAHTLDEIDFLRVMIPYRPDVVVLLYTFNDIDYLQPVTARSRLTDGPESLWTRLSPMRVAFINSYFVQEIWVRSRLILRQIRGDVLPADPYLDTTVVEQHLTDLREFASLAEAAGAVVGIVPFDISVRAHEAIRTRHRTFVEAAERAGLNVWPVGGAFDGVPYDALTVNTLDRHPNERANALAADAVASRLATEFESPEENAP
jgi:hypothetical protein